MPFVLAALLGALTALCGLPLAWSFLTPLPLAGLLWLVAVAPTPRRAAGLMLTAMFVFFAAQLAWLPQSFGSGFGVFGYAMFLPVFALEGLFWALLAWLVARLLRWPESRLWGLAAGWVLLEWLRHLGPFAFPWSTLGYTTLPTPAVQSADLWGVLGLSLLVTATAAALARLAGGQWRPAAALAVVWAGCVAYGLTRTPGLGPETRALLLRTAINSFDKNADLETLTRASLPLSAQAQPGETVVWSETALPASWLDSPQLSAQLPNPLITGVLYPAGNAAVAWDGRVEARYDKVKLVPFGEYFPLKTELRPLYLWLFARLGIGSEFPEPGTRSLPLTLTGVRYGTSICYDDVFGQLARDQARGGAELLVNVSNDGWFQGWGVEQHFQMGRLRAIETRRWLLRSVNDGVTAVTDDLGRVRQRLDTGEGVLHARPLRLSSQTLYVRLGDWPVLGLSALLIVLALVADTNLTRRQRWR